MTEPTQVRHPLRATARTVFAFIVGLAALLPVVISAAGLSTSLPWVAAALVVAGAVTRIMAIPAVNDFLERFLPFLGARGNQSALNR